MSLTEAGFEHVTIRSRVQYFSNLRPVRLVCGLYRDVPISALSFVVCIVMYPSPLFPSFVVCIVMYPSPLFPLRSVSYITHLHLSFVCGLYRTLPISTLSFVVCIVHYPSPLFPLFVVCIVHYPSPLFPLLSVSYITHLHSFLFYGLYRDVPISTLSFVVCIVHYPSTLFLLFVVCIVMYQSPPFLFVFVDSTFWFPLI